MQIFRTVWLAALAMAALSSAPPDADARVAAGVTRMTIGDPQAGHIDFAVTRARGSAKLIAIHLHRVGAPGSRFTLSIAGRPVVAPFILSEAQCRFDAEGSLCDLAIGRNDRAYRPLLAAFRSGRRARVTVENAGNVAMSTEVSLRALTRSASATSNNDR
jgi:hypothetical protein